MSTRQVSTTCLKLGVATVIALCLPTPANAQQDTTEVQQIGLTVTTDTAIVQDTTQVQEAHPQDSPGTRGFVIITGDRKASLRIRGSLRVNGAYDLRGLQNQDNFNTFQIPVGNANIADPRFFMSANQTRLGLEMLTDTKLGDVFVKVETDFRAAGQTGDDVMRLRHAFGTLGNFLVGQTWSVFGDVASLPNTVDLDGPNSSVAVRTLQVRYAIKGSDMWQFAVSAESPSPQIATEDSAQFDQVFQATPDIAGRVRRLGPYGHTQLAVVLRTINVKDTAGDLQVLPGWGALFSGDISLGNRTQLLFQLVGGKGISRFITALDGQGLDVVFNPNSTSFETLGAAGGFVAVGYGWRENVLSYLTLGAINVENKDFAPADAFDNSQYASVNAFWTATAGTQLGAELSLGRRQNQDGQDGTAVRLSFIMYFDF